MVVSRTNSLRFVLRAAKAGDGSRSVDGLEASFAGIIVQEKILQQAFQHMDNEGNYWLEWKDVPMVEQEVEENDDP